MSEATSPQSTTAAMLSAPRATPRTFSASCSSPTSSTTSSASSSLASASPSSRTSASTTSEFGSDRHDFFLVYTIFALPLGFLADRIGRKLIVGWGMLLASLRDDPHRHHSHLSALLVGAKSLFGLGQSGFYPAGHRCSPLSTRPHGAPV